MMKSNISPVILVTGGLGYLGSQLIRDLVSADVFDGVTVRILDNMQEKYYSSLMNLPEEGHYEFIKGDILDPATLRLALKGVSTVIHLAAIVRTPMSFENPAWMEQVNHWGTAHLVEACLETEVEKFIFASSTAVYGPGGVFAENHPCRPQGTYAQSKQRAEQVVQVASRRGLQTTILRLGTIYGVAPIIRFDAVANRFAYHAGIGRSLTVYGNGEQKRSLIHVKNASEAVIFSLHQPELTNGKVLNVVEQNVSILELTTILQQIKPEVTIQFTEQDVRTHLSFEASNAVLTSLGWKPKIRLKDGLSEIIAQFKNIQTMKIQGVEFE